LRKGALPIDGLTIVYYYSLMNLLLKHEGRKKDMAEIAYCVKCKAKNEMNDGEKVTMKNGRPAMKGKCSKCGTGMYKILSSK
jgi:hypothetical protein